LLLHVRMLSSLLVLGIETNWFASARQNAFLSVSSRY
jgi:hypothetical protein